MPDMSTWRKASTMAALAARRQHALLGTDVSSPVDVFDAIERAGLILAFFPLQHVSGAYVAEPDGQPGVLVNSEHPLSRQRYTAAHEFGHHVMGHGTLVDGNEPLHRTVGRTVSRQEKEAEAFAGWFLMPRPLVDAHLLDMGIDAPNNPAALYELALRLQTSYEATAWHLVDLKRLDAASARALLATRPREVKLALAGEQPPEDLRNDVWPLDESANGRTVSIRDGDRIILRLRERPAVGEFWEPRDVPSSISIEDEAFEPERDVLEFPPDDRPVGTALVHTYALTAMSPDGPSSGRLSLFRGPIGESEFAINLEVHAPRRGVSEHLLVI